ncbi:hypothetical protein N864_14625 [Intrasporangium chromatireducens Q5-1]|uniref:Uncharacterized protein n=1 Tax=Intrasporangium chromatireducens Q5-1 TaxID=584657 RepID=W9GHK0_9MICO|nr:hypothetical protein [Intrasporangium chromatireducens]EWT04303.1 hypothetical protein N864_14625 [Intrasporangium chromatireducens Q5-1]
MLPSHLTSALPTLLPAAGAFGAGRLFALIIVVFLAILAVFIVPLEVRLRRERRAQRGQQPGNETPGRRGGPGSRRDEA